MTGTGSLTIRGRTRPRNAARSGEYLSLRCTLIAEHGLNASFSGILQKILNRMKWVGAGFRMGAAPRPGSTRDRIARPMGQAGQGGRRRRRCRTCLRSSVGMTPERDRGSSVRRASTPRAQGYRDRSDVSGNRTETRTEEDGLPLAGRPELRRRRAFSSAPRRIKTSSRTRHRAAPVTSSNRSSPLIGIVRISLASRSSDFRSTTRIRLFS